MKIVKTNPFRLIVALLVLLTVFVVRDRQKTSGSFLGGSTMGTSYSITITDRLRRAKLDRIGVAVTERLLDMDYEMSSWNPDSQISQFNNRRDTKPFTVSPELAEVVQCALEMSALTDGAFDPTVKPLVDHWGFGPDTDDDLLDEIMQAVGWQKVRVEKGALVKMHPDVQLDLSAIAKGYGVDAVAEVIRSFGLKNFLVEIGGEIVVSGINPKGKPWRVGIESPQFNAPGGAQIFQTLELRGGAMATSGDYRNFRTREDGTRYSHIIDPKTGRPAETDVASVSVLANSCMDADAAATAFFVTGSEKSFQWLENHPELEVFFILHSTNQTFTTRATDGFPE